MHITISFQEPGIAQAVVTSFWGMRRRSFICVGLSKITGGRWINTKTGNLLHWASDLRERLNLAAALAMMQTPTPAPILPLPR